MCLDRCLALCATPICAAADPCLEALRASTRFGRLSHDLLELMAEAATTLTVGRDAVVVHENAPATALYMVVSGGVKLIKTGADGREFIVTLIGPGRSFGERALFDPRGHDTAAVAVLDSTLVRIDGRTVRDLTHRFSDLALTMIESLSGTIRRLTDHLEGLAMEQMEQRLARLLIELATDFGRPMIGGTKLRVRLTRQMLADMVGATVETTIRILSRWTKDRLIVTSHHEITLLAPNRLRSLTQPSRN